MNPVMDASVDVTISGNRKKPACSLISVGPLPHEHAIAILEQVKFLRLG